MNKKKLVVLCFIFIIGLLAACNGDDEASNSRVTTNDTGTDLGDDMVRLTISINNGSQFINEQEVEIEEGANLLEVLEKTFYVETNDEGVIRSIERQKVDTEKNTKWVLIVNDEPTDTPAKDFTLTGGQRITFDLQ